MIVPIVIGAAALYGYYRYDKSKKMAAALNAAPPAGSPAASSGYQYPAATSQLDPNASSTQQAVLRFQKAAPTPTGKYYQPVDGDLASIILLRFDPETDDKGHALPGNPGMFMANFGKLNGFLGLGDLAKLIAAKKPLHLPAESTDKGARQYASGAVTQR